MDVCENDAPTSWVENMKNGKRRECETSLQAERIMSKIKITERRQYHAEYLHSGKGRDLPGRSE